MNQFIHILAVWPILISAQLFFQYSFYPYWASLIFSLAYILYYLNIDEKISGSISAFLVFLSYSLTFYLYSLYQITAIKYALYIHFICWILQFIGHAIFEKKRPALLDSLSQSFIMAPLFVILEICFITGTLKNLEQKLKKNLFNLRIGV